MLKDYDFNRVLGVEANMDGAIWFLGICQD